MGSGQGSARRSTLRYHAGPRALRAPRGPPSEAFGIQPPSGPWHGRAPRRPGRSRIHLRACAARGRARRPPGRRRDATRRAAGAGRSARRRPVHGCDRLRRAGPRSSRPPVQPGPGFQPDGGTVFEGGDLALRGRDPLLKQGEPVLSLRTGQHASRVSLCQGRGGTSRTQPSARPRSGAAPPGHG